jgi:hypothetical protein
VANSVQDRQVLNYLRELDAALTALPPKAAAELREQITAHLRDALSPDADDEAVWAVLRKLGRPRDLVTEAQGSLPTSPAPPAAAGSGAVVDIARRRNRRRRWPLVAAVLVVSFAITGAVFDHLISEWSARGAGPLTTNAWGWVYDADSRADVTTTAADKTQDTVPIRPNSVQGLYIDLWNGTKYTQAILGPSHDFFAFGAQSYSLMFSAYEDPRGGFNPPAAGPWRSTPVSIAPGKHRILRLTWQTASLICESPGGGSAIESLSLRVHVGWYTRTDTIVLPTAFALMNTSKTAIGSSC